MLILYIVTTSKTMAHCKIISRALGASIGVLPWLLLAKAVVKFLVWAWLLAPHGQQGGSKYSRRYHDEPETGE